MNSISSISFGEVILSDNVKKAMQDSQENPAELNHLKETKPDCFIDLVSTKKGDCYLKATETWGGYNMKKAVTAKLFLKQRKVPYVSDILTLYENFQKAVEKRNMKYMKF